MIDTEQGRDLERFLRLSAYYVLTLSDEEVKEINFDFDSDDPGFWRNLLAPPLTIEADPDRYHDSDKNGDYSD
jgi:hypothetical protein